MTSRMRANAASLMVIVVVVAVGRLILQPHDTTSPPTPGYAPTVAVCVVSPQVRVRPVGLVNEP